MCNHRYLLLGILIGILVSGMALDASVTCSFAGDRAHGKGGGSWQATAGAISVPADVTTTNTYVPMLMFNRNGGINLYLYNPSKGGMDTIKENSHISWLLSLNPDKTLGVYADGVHGDDPFSINVYNITTEVTTTISAAGTRWESAYFDSDGKILFIGSSDGNIKKMDSDGGNITLVATPESPYTFRIFWLSPDRNLIAAIEENRSCDNYYACNYDRLVLLNTGDGSRLMVTSPYLGEWNMLSWKHDSSGFLYYYHTFSGSRKVPQYDVYDVSNPTFPIVTSFSGSEWTREENICLFTTTGKLLSLKYRNLYEGGTGTLIRSMAPYVPKIGQSMMGIDDLGDIWFADADGANFRRFAECVYAISPKGRTVGYKGASGKIRLSTSLQTCDWTATPSDAWITIESGGSGTGGGTIEYSIPANPGVSQRIGTITVAGRVFNVTQSGAPCKITSMSKTKWFFDKNGGADSFDVTAPEGCSWMASADSKSTWISVSSSGTGNGTVSYSVDPNDTTKARTGRITISTVSTPVNKKVFTITEDYK